MSDNMVDLWLGVTREASEPMTAPAGAQRNGAREVQHVSQLSTPEHLPAESTRLASAAAHSWTPIPLTVAGAAPPEPPSLAGFVYPDRVHVWSGEPEALKSLTALVVGLEAIRAGRCNVYLDLEANGERETLSRLHALGLDDDEIDAGFLYLAPTEPLTDPTIRADVERLLADRRPAMVIVDSYTASLAMHGCDPDRGVDVERHAQTVVRTLREAGSAVVLLDHLTKDREKRGRYSIGSERKLGIADVHLGFEVASPFGRGRRGVVHLTVHKDRPAHLPRPRAAELEFRSERASGAIHFEIRLAENAGADNAGSPFRPTVLMERVSRYLESQLDPASRTNVEENVTGKVEYLRVAMDCLLDEGCISEVAGARTGRLMTSIRPFREHDPVPTPSFFERATPPHPVPNSVLTDTA